MGSSRRGVNGLRGLGRSLDDVYRRLRRHQGPAGWWPGETSFEVCLGAILVQNTAWTNAARALDALRARGLLAFDALDRLTTAEIAPLVRSSGCFNVKARRLRAFLDFLGQAYGGRAEAMRHVEAATLRRQLLAVPGIGLETADSIALYAAERPLFVIDAYTRRVFARLGLVAGDEPYDVLQRRFMDALHADVALYNDYHAQIVRLAQGSCRARPACASCPLRTLCPSAGALFAAGPG